MSAEDRVPTNLRTLLILEALSQSSAPLTPTEINKVVGLPKQSIHRLCQTMMDEGFLIRDVSGKRLRPATRTLEMSRGLQMSQQVTAARRQILLSLSEATGETVNFVVPEPDGMTYLDRIETDWVFRIELPIGSRVPFHCTASGKCYLASLDRKTRSKTLRAIFLERRTKNTFVEIDALAEELDLIAMRGYAFDNEELFDGMVALAVPILDPKKRFIAAVAFHGPTQRLTKDVLMQHLPAMNDVAARLAEHSA